ncbi:MAG: GTPase HflX [Caldithrix sp.]|nr:GTPase HflX [Caldithrix sp.]
MIENINTLVDIDHERCVLVGIVQQQQTRWEVIDHLDELKALAQTTGAEVLDSVIQQRTAPDAAYFIGKGKLEHIACIVDEKEAQIVIFDDDLSPAQVKNIESILPVKVIDRSALILDIFARHAQSREAKVQVELAQLNYLLPRLTRQWQHLSRQVGGIGTKGPGETQLETDRRLVRQRIANLENRLEQINRQRATQSQKRDTRFRAALIGYTNAGKSTLMNCLTNATVHTKNELFATLDTTVRRLTLDNQAEVLLSDTVGFIRKLPHHLIASFRSTLAEAMNADILIHVIDISHPHFEEQIRVVKNILSELDTSETRSLLVFNKMDSIPSNGLLQQIKSRYPNALFLSARRHIGVNQVKQRLQSIMEESFETKQIKLNYKFGDAEYLIHPLATVLDKSYDEQYLYLTIKYPRENKEKILELSKKYV